MGSDENHSSITTDTRQFGARNEQRFTVDSRAKKPVIDAVMQTLLRRCPSDRVEYRSPHTLRLRKEPPIMFAMAAASLLTAGLLMHVLSLTVRRLTHVPTGYAWLLELIGLVTVFLAYRQWQWRLTVHTNREELLIETTAPFTATNRRTVPIPDVDAIVVQSVEGHRNVMVIGPRHAVLAVVFRESLLDPQSLVPWLAEMIARLCELHNCESTQRNQVAL